MAFSGPTPTKLATATVSAWQRKFLNDEERATASLQAFFGEARSELEEFIRTGPLTKADQAFYSNLLQQVQLREGALLAGAKEWIDQTIPTAYVTGAQTHFPDIRFSVVHDDAVKALSRSTLDLITKTTIDMRLAVQQQIAQGLLQGLSGQDIRNRLLQSGLTNIPHWPSADYRAGVIARTETMRAYNDGALDAIEATGAKFVRWIASPDEATCSICLPRSGKVYRIGAGPGTIVKSEATGHKFVGELVERYGVKAKLKIDPNVAGAFSNAADLITLSTQALQEGGTQLNFHVDATPTGVITHEYGHLVQSHIGKPAQEIAKRAWRDPPSPRAREGGSTLPGPNAEAFAEAFAAYHLQGVDRWGMEDLLRQELGDRAAVRTSGTDPYPKAIPLPSKPPAHPRCRCTIRAEYRGPDGSLIGDETPIAQPAPDPVPELPPAAGDLDSAIARTRTTAGDPTLREFWRGLGPLDKAQISKLTSGKAGLEQFRLWANFMDYRYGVKFVPSGLWASDLFASALTSIERLRALVPRFVVDSRRFKVLGAPPAGARGFDLSTIARCFQSGEIEYQMSSWSRYVRGQKRDELDIDIDGGEAVTIHEIAHAIQNRYGINSKGLLFGGSDEFMVDNPTDRAGALLDSIRKAEAVDAEWSAVRRKSSGMGIAPNSISGDPAAKIRESLEFYAAYPAMVKKLNRQLADLAKVEAGTKDLFPSSYAKSGGAGEDFAESVALYVLHPAKLRKFSRNRYEFIRNRIFEGVGG